jgi:hypothetical protein
MQLLCPEPRFNTKVQGVACAQLPKFDKLAEWKSISTAPLPFRRPVQKYFASRKAQCKPGRKEESNTNGGCTPWGSEAGHRNATHRAMLSKRLERLQLQQRSELHKPLWLPSAVHAAAAAAASMN